MLPLRGWQAVVAPRSHPRGLKSRAYHDNAPDRQPQVSAGGGRLPLRRWQAVGSPPSTPAN